MRKLTDLDTDLQFTRGMLAEFLKLQKEIAPEDLELSEFVGGVTAALAVLDKAILRRVTPLRKARQEAANKRRINKLRGK